MTVKRLIEELQKQDMNARVMLHNGFDEEEVLFCLSYVDGKPTNNVWLSSENDYDMTEEINSRFECADKDWIDELNFYMDLLEIGINIDMVRRYIGEEQVNHMKNFCEEHGLI